jgi:hypothetical protein
MEFVRDCFALSGLNDAEFAKMAADKLGFAITSHNVQRAREDFSIPSLRDSRGGEGVDLRMKLHALEVRLASLELRVKTYFVDAP